MLGENGGTLCMVFDTLELAEKVLNQIRVNRNDLWDNIQQRYGDGKYWIQLPEPYRPQDISGVDPNDYVVEENTGGLPWVDPMAI